MIIGGAAILVFNLGQQPEVAQMSNLWNDGGFFPNGVQGMIASFILVLFAFGGTEIIGVAGSEADDPERSIPKAVNTVPARILLFYVLAISIILILNPWRTITGEESPFVQIFNTLGVNWAAGLLNFVVITAALSAINADLFGTGRVLTGLAKENLAPRRMAKTYRDVPVMTFINKMDRPGADFHRIVGMLSDRIGARPLIVQLPIGSDGTFTGVVDLVRNKAIVWKDEGLGAVFSEMKFSVVPPNCLG